jgi:hypothetical protein
MPITNQPEWDRSREEAVRICRAVLNGEKGVIEAARILSRVRFDLDAENDSDFLIFVGIDSETDHLPVGETRNRWNPEALRLKDRELAEAESLFRKRAYDACEGLIKKYSGT